MKSICIFMLFLGSMSLFAQTKSTATVPTTTPAVNETAPKGVASSEDPLKEIKSSKKKAKSKVASKNKHKKKKHK